MAQDVEPFDYQKTNNMDEHKQIVDKVNEIVDVINNANIEDVPALRDEVSSLDLKVTSMESTVAQHTIELAENNTDIESISESLANKVDTSAIADMETKTHAQATYQPIGDYATKAEIPDVSNFATKTELSELTGEMMNSPENVIGIGITTNNNVATVNGKTANIINSISGNVDEDNNLIITINGVSGSGIPLPKSENNPIIVTSSMFLIPPVDEGEEQDIFAVFNYTNNQIIESNGVSLISASRPSSVTLSSPTQTMKTYSIKSVGEYQINSPSFNVLCQNMEDGDYSIGGRLMNTTSNIVCTLHIIIANGKVTSASIIPSSDFTVFGTSHAMYFVFYDANTLLKNFI